MAKKGTSLAFTIIKPFIFLLLPFFFIINLLPGPNGQPIFTWTSDLKSWFSQLKTPSLPTTNHPFRMQQPETVELYRWQDDKGLWHFSEKKPDNQNHVETFKVSTKLNNIMPKPKEIHQPSSDNKPGHTVITPLNVLQKAKDLQKQAENRNQVLDSL